ncbi:hypothetical protein JOY44_30305 (plasmid) [Phormidium sp. CLA17]|nr:hypothetical protein [Leptolyngbya sp. Cla-17]
MSLTRRACTNLTIIMSLSGLVPALTVKVPYRFTDAPAVAATSTPSSTASEPPQSNANEKPLKPDYGQALIRFLGIFGALAVAMWVNRRRR